jgi:hypothetical protein
MGFGSSFGLGDVGGGQTIGFWTGPDGTSGSGRSMSWKLWYVESDRARLTRESGRSRAVR